MFKKIFNLPTNLFNLIRHFPRHMYVLFHDWIWQILTFSLLLSMYLIDGFARKLEKIPFIPGFIKKPVQLFTKLSFRVVSVIQGDSARTLNRINLIDLAIKNMSSKKSRAIVTIGGMSVGIGSIVFLVSIGYGINKLVVDKVARLEEMIQTDVSPQPGSNVRITDETLSRLQGLSEISKSLPLIASVARVNYQNSVSDMAVYGVTADYLKESAIKTTVGEIFTNTEIATNNPATFGQVAGITDQPDLQNPKIGTKISDIEFKIQPEQWVKVRTKPDISSQILGFSRHNSSSHFGEETWGSTYISNDKVGNFASDDDGKRYGKWVKVDLPLWKEQVCVETIPDCVDGTHVVLRDEAGNQQTQTGYIAQLSITVNHTYHQETGTVLGLATDGYSQHDVLGESDLLALAEIDQSVLNADIASESGWIEIASEAGIISPPDKKTVTLASSAEKVAVVNRAMLQVLGIQETDAVGKTFQSSFIIVGNLLDSDEQVESIPADYTIIGVVPDDRSPYFYVPFIDLRGLGITNFSQVKIVVKNQSTLAEVRQQIEAMGFTTSSVADTVAQIDRLFATARTILALLGMVALGVASLGMFNTLTVSLLERTREVGLMKAMGMKSHEVRELFLTESMIMGFLGGIFGIALGFVAGKLVGVILSLVSLSKGQGMLDVSYIPTPFILVVFSLSLLVGIITGIYPAHRARKISALDALRYE